MKEEEKVMILMDIFKIKKVLGDHMAILGDVPAALFALGTPEAVTEYCNRLLGEIGPEGFILSSGCDLPPGTPLRNLAAFFQAVKDA